MATILPPLTDFIKDKPIKANPCQLFASCNNIDNSTDLVVKQFESNKEMQTQLLDNWQGDTANQFQIYCSKLNASTSIATGSSKFLSNNTKSFAIESLDIDFYAGEKTK